MLTLRKYQKHVATLIDEIVFDYYALMKSLDYDDYDYTEFSSIIYNLYDESEDIFDFISNIKESMKYLDINDKAKILLKRLDLLYKYEKYARTELA